MTMASIVSSSVLGDDTTKVCYAGYMYVWDRLIRKRHHRKHDTIAGTMKLLFWSVLIDFLIQVQF